MFVHMRWINEPCVPKRYSLKTRNRRAATYYTFLTLFTVLFFCLPKIVYALPIGYLKIHIATFFIFDKKNCCLIAKMSCVIDIIIRKGYFVVLLLLLLP